MPCLHGPDLTVLSVGKREHDDARADKEYLWVGVGARPNARVKRPVPSVPRNSGIWSTFPKELVGMDNGGMRACRNCGASLTKKPGPGRWPLRCPACRPLDYRRVERSRPCTKCGAAIVRPPGKVGRWPDYCAPCRRRVTR